MSNGEEELVEQVNRALRLSTKIGMMVMDGTRDPRKVADHLQLVLNESARFVADMFAPLSDLGIITVPDGYDHATWLATFREKHQGGKKKSFYFYNDDLTDTNFSNPSRILKPGDKLQVCAFKQVVSGSTTSEERMAYLETQKMNVYVGAQGASLVFDQKRDQLPKGKWYASFDEAKRLWKDAVGRHRVPGVSASSGGGFNFVLGNLEGVWGECNAFLGFCDAE